jgi:hypothetical protein
MAGNGTTAPDRQLRNEWGIQSNLAALAAQVGDRAYADGLTMPWIEGFWGLTSLGWVFLGGAGGGITSVAQGDGITCTPNPIIAAGIVAVRYGNTATDVNTGNHTHSGAAGMGNILPPTSVTDPGTLNPANVLLNDHLNDPLIHSVAALQPYSPPERPDAFHFWNNLIDTHGYEVETGYETQRCMAYSATYANTYYVFMDDNILNAETETQICLRIENHNTTLGSKGARERVVWDVILQMYDYLGDPITQGMAKDMCLVIDQQDVLHIYFTADNYRSRGFKGVFDCYIPISGFATLQAPQMASGSAPPAPMNIIAQAELVNTVDGGDCTHMSAAYTSRYTLPLGTVTVVWRQDVGQSSLIWANNYDPTGVAGLRYTTLIPGGQIGLSESGVDADWPSVEFGAMNAYCMWVEDNGAGVYGWKFATSPNLAGGFLTWNVLASGLMVSDYIVGCPSDIEDPFSFVVSTYNGNLDIISAVCRNNGGQGEKVFVVIYGDFLTTGLGAAYNCSLYDTYRTNSPTVPTGVLGARTFFQLGITHILFGPGEDAPVVQMLHTERDGYFYSGGNVSTYSTYLTLFVPDLVAGIIPATIPISPSAVVGDSGLSALIVQISPKVHYAYYCYNRQWQNETSQPYRYYPMMVHGKLVLGTFTAKVGGGWSVEVISSLWMKDTPEYPFKNDVHIY